jgi:glutathione S-transferase
MGTGLTLYGCLDSGNGYKIRLLLAQLSRPYTYRELDITKGASRTPEFLHKNPNGRTRTLELEDGTCLAESNAILWDLAEGSAFLPSEPLLRARAPTRRRLRDSVARSAWHATRKIIAARRYASPMAEGTE